MPRHLSVAEILLSVWKYFAIKQDEKLMMLVVGLFPIVGEELNKMQIPWNSSLSCFSDKGGYPQFMSATPQYCGLPNRLRSCGLKKVAELRLRTFKSWLPQFRNFQQSPASSVTFSSPYSSAQDGFKNQPKIFLELSVSLENKNLP